MISIKTIYNNLRDLMVNSGKTLKEIHDLKFVIGQTLVQKSHHAKNIQDAEFKVFSQWGDDGIIQYLIKHVAIENKFFVEFGVENYTESNTRFLLMHDNWSGLVMDGSENNIAYIKNDEIYWRYELTAKKAFITAENINDLLAQEQIAGPIGILHIDIDGNDYWIWKSITVVDPAIVIVEFNSVFGSERPIVVPYQADFMRNKVHYSNLYFGCSIVSLCDLADEKGYTFVGCNSAGNNAYFVKKNKAGALKTLTAAEGYVASRFRESRNEKGALTFMSGAKKFNLIRGLEVLNTRTNLPETL